jgi:hypothetical protein
MTFFNQSEVQEIAGNPEPESSYWDSGFRKMIRIWKNITATKATKAPNIYLEYHSVCPSS